MKYVLYIWILFQAMAPIAQAGIVAETSDTVRFRQADGVEVVLHKNPQRTIICFASLVDAWYASGGEAVATVKVRSLDSLPEAARTLPTVGAVTVPNPEKVLEMRPDLVLLNYKLELHRALAELLRANGIEAVCLEYVNYADFSLLVNLFGKLNAPKSNALTGEIEAEVKSICIEYQEYESKPKVAILFAATAGFSLETPQSNTGKIVEMLGGDNILREAEDIRIDFSYEQLLLENPDVIFVIPMGDAKALQEKFKREIMSQPAWQSLRASQANRVHFLPPEWSLYQAGTRYGEAFRHIARLLYPSSEATKQ